MASRASVTLSIACSMKDAGRNTLGVELDPRQAGLQRCERVLDAAGDLERVGLRELLDHEHQARAVVDDGVADQRLVVLHDRGHVARGGDAVRVL